MFFTVLLSIFTVLIILFLIWIVVRFIIYYSKNVNKRYPKIKYSEIKFNDGDIILFINRTHAMINSIGLISPWTHAGIVVNINGIPYISESNYGNYVSLNGDNNTFPNRSQLNNLQWRLNEYPGECFIIQLKKPMSNYQIKKFHKLVGIKTEYPNSPKNVIKHFINRKSAQKSRHCMQHVSWIMDQLELAEPDSCGSLFLKGFLNTAEIFDNISHKKLKCGNSYRDIYKIIFDKFDNTSKLYHSSCPI